MPELIGDTYELTEDEVQRLAFLRRVLSNNTEVLLPAQAEDGTKYVIICAPIAHNGDSLQLPVAILAFDALMKSIRPLNPDGSVVPEPEGPFRVTEDGVARKLSID